MSVFAHNLFGFGVANPFTARPMAIDIIPPERGAPMRLQPLFLDDARVSDAEFRDLGKSVGVPGDGERFHEVPRHSAASTPQPAPRADRFAASRLSLTGPGMFAAGVVVLSAASFWLFGGHALAGRAVADQLAISDVETKFVEADGQWLLDVKGKVENRGRRGAAVPLILLETANGRAVAVEPASSRLGAGASLAFATRLALGEDESSHLRISLAQEADLAHLASLR